MHEATRRRIARLTFLLLGLLPTVVLAGWGLSRQLPGYTEALEEQLSGQLGLAVAIDEVSHPRPGVLLLSGLELSDAESGRLLLHCRLIEACRSGERLELAVHQAEIQAEHAGQLWQLLQRRLSQSIAAAPVHLDIACGQLTWHDGAGSPTLVNVQAHVGSAGDGIEAAIHFSLAGAASGEPMACTLLRTASQGTRLDFSTGSTPLPCSMLRPLLDGPQWLGSRARFRGTLWATHAAGRWQGELFGQLSQVDLDALVTDHFPHGLGGLADIRIDRAAWRDGRLEEASGGVVAGPGQISRSLLAAARETLSLGAGAAPLPSTTVVPYAQLQFDLAIADNRLLLHGRCPGGDGALLVDAQQRSLWTQPPEPQPVVALLRALVPYSQLQVPATRQTDWLMSRLPVPEVRPDAAAAQLPQPHMRLAPR